MEYQVLYDVTKENIFLEYFFYHATGMWIFATIFFWKMKKRASKGARRFLLGTVLFSSVLWIEIVASFSYMTYKNKTAYQNGEYIVIEGLVKNFKRTKDVGGVESFEVEGVQFELGGQMASYDAEYWNPGPIRNNILLRISYTSKSHAILKLEIVQK